MCSNVVKQDIYVSTRQDSKASMQSSDYLVYSYGLPPGFRNIIEDSENFKKVRGETFVFSTEFSFPFTKFSRFLIIELTKKPTEPKHMAQIIDTFKSRMSSNLTSDLINREFGYIFPYLEDTGAFLIKHKSVGVFPKMRNLMRKHWFRVSGIER